MHLKPSWLSHNFLSGFILNVRLTNYFYLGDVRRPIVILIILSIYVLFQFIWWAYLMINLNEELYLHKIENVAFTPLTQEERELEISQLENKLSMRRWMVFGEGAVFLSLLLWGTIMMIKAYKKEILLARQQKNFLLSITHEFKSPLAAIKLYMQTLLRHDLDKEKKLSFINSAINDTERLNSLVENALLANLIDHKGYSFNKEEINFSALVRLLAQKFQQVPDHGKIGVQVEEGVFIYADKNAMMILINNLLENAWKYSPKEKNISISCLKVSNTVILEVMDNGEGIPDNEKPKIFTKFYRVGNEETRKTKGTGLGLFISKYIVDNHQGKISVSDNEPNGTIVRIELPSLNQPAE